MISSGQSHHFCVQEIMSTRTAIIVIIASFIIGGIATWGAEYLLNHDQATDNCQYELDTDDHFEWVKPLLFAEPKCESQEHQDLKLSIENTIDSLVAAGTLDRASFYWRDFDKGNWIGVHPEQEYHPGSLLKLGAFYNILQQASQDTTLLNQRLTYHKTEEKIPAQTFSKKSIGEGQSYSIMELLEYMVAYSDNYATSLLHNVMSYPKYLQIFSSLHLPLPDGSNPNYSVTASQFSNFFKVLYNGTFLNPSMSELAIKLLMKCDFDQGMVAGLPQDTKIAHKFGEWGNREGQHELHEMAIIYLGNKPYLLTIFTSGKELKQLSPSLAVLTKKTHQYLRALNRKNSIHQ